MTKTKLRKSAKNRRTSKSTTSSDVVVAGIVGAAPSVVNRTRSPRIFMRGSHTVVSHDEYVGDVITDTNNEFAYDYYNINPGNSILFPWLSVIASRFESYRFSRFEATYRGMTSTSVGGAVILSVDYDPEEGDTGQQTKQTLLQNEGSLDGTPWTTFTHRSSLSNLRRLGPYRFVQNADQETPSRTDSAGVLYVATTPMVVSPGTDIGDLWISYEVEFITPVIVLPVALNAPQYQHLTGYAVNGTNDALSPLNSLYGTFMPSLSENKDYRSVIALLANQSVLGYDASPAINGIPGFPSILWEYGSGTAVATGQSIIAAASDFVGQVVVHYHSIGSVLANTVPNFGSLLVGLAASGLSAPNYGTYPELIFGEGVPSSISTIAYTILESFATNANSVQNTGYVVLDCVLPAYSGLVLTVPIYFGGNQIAMNIYTIPGNSGRADAYRRIAKAIAEGKPGKFEPRKIKPKA